MSTANSAKPALGRKIRLIPHTLAAVHSQYSEVEITKVLAALGLLGTTLLWSLHV